MPQQIALVGGSRIVVDAVEQRMGKTSKIGSEMPEIGHSLWSNSSTPTTIINTQSTSRSTIFSIGDNVLPISPDLQSTSSEMQPRSQQQFTRYSMGLSSLEKLKTNFRSAESHEKVDKSRGLKLKRLGKLLKCRPNHRKRSTYVGASPHLSDYNTHSCEMVGHKVDMSKPSRLNSESTWLDSQSEFEKMIRCGVDVAVLRSSVGSEKKEKKKNRCKWARQKQEKIVTLFLGGFGRDKFFGWCRPGAKHLSCRFYHCIQLDGIQSINIFDPSKSPMRDIEPLKGKWEKDNRRFIELVGTSYKGKIQELTILLNNDMVDNIIWQGFVNLEQELMFATMEMSSSCSTTNFSQASSLL